METTDFERFVASQQETGVDTKTRDEWLNDLDSLYRKIAGFLREYVKAGSITYDFTEIELAEPGIGTYLAKRMDIKIGRQRVSLVPVGTLLVGCRGRVDAQGVAGQAQILLVDERVRSAADLIKVTVSVKGNLPSSPPEQKPVSWAWKILTNTVQRRFVDLDQESFFALLMEVANG